MSHIKKQRWGVVFLEILTQIFVKIKLFKIEYRFFLHVTAFQIMITISNYISLNRTLVYKS